MLRVSLFLFLLNLVYSLPLTAQEYSYVNYNTREGLAGSVVYCMVQDLDGFMWFGTETGLSRFDGTRFKNFTTGDGLPDNEIIRLFVDSKNRIWIAPFKNSLCYYWRGKIYNAGNDSLLRSLKLKGEVQSIVENAAGDIAIVEMGAVTIVNHNGKILRFTETNGIPFMGAAWAGILENGSFGFAMSVSYWGTCLLEFSGDNLRLNKYLTSVGNYFQPQNYGIDPQIFRNLDSIKLIFRGRQVTFRNPEQFTAIHQINDSLIAINSSKVEIYNFRKNITERVLLAGTVTNSVFVDREDNFWFATMGEGVFKLASLEYRNYFMSSEKNMSPVFSVLKSGDRIYAGSSGLKLWTINTATGAIKGQKLARSDNNIGRIVTLNKLRDGSLVAGTDHNLIKVKGNSIRVADSIYGAVKSVFISGDSIVVGTSIATVLLNDVQLSIVDTIWQGRTTAVFKRGPRIFIGTLHGLYILDTTDRFTYAGDLHAALRSKISAISEDRAGNIWIATNGDGVVGYRDGRVFALIKSDQGLTSNICRSLFAAADILWIGTEQGLNKVTITDSGYQIRRYTISDGLISNIINSIWVDGATVYVATPQGITFFDENKVTTNSMCELKITSVQSHSQHWSFDTSGLVFGYNDRDIRIEFAGISFKSPGEIFYRYRLRGRYNEWQQTQDNFLNYAELPSGSYELELQATNKFGIRSKTVKVAFVIEKPFWEKIWFRSLILILLAVIIWKFVQNRIQKVRKQEAEKAAYHRKIAEFEQMALKAQMNPHFIFNSLHSIQQFVMDKDVRGANKFITDFARLIRLTLNISRQPKVSLETEINYISTYLELEKTRLESKFDFTVNVSPEINRDATFIPAMILQPFVENSIRHGISNRNDYNGLINVSFRTENDYLVCAVQDNGIGRKASYFMKRDSQAAHESKGMELTQHRVDLLNNSYGPPIILDIGDVVDKGEIKGTKVIICFPIGETKKPE